MNLREKKRHRLKTKREAAWEVPGKASSEATESSPQKLQ
jgi:hypothetical protein